MACYPQPRDDLQYSRSRKFHGEVWGNASFVSRHGRGLEMERSKDKREPEEVPAFCKFSPVYFRVQPASGYQGVIHRESTLYRWGLYRGVEEALVPREGARRSNCYVTCNRGAAYLR